MARRRRDRRGSGEESGAKSPPRSSSQTRTEAKADDQALTPNRRTAIYAGAGLLLVILGFFLLHLGSLALAPVLLVLGFLVFIPLAIVK
jgi:hypothetical protein